MEARPAMPFIGELTLEFCDRETVGPSREELVQALRATPRSAHDWYLTLTRTNGEYIDVLVTEDASFEIQCLEDGKKMLSTASVDEAMLEALVLAFFDHDRNWKGATAWRELPSRRGLPGLFR
jgi:hypothetical protein